MYNVCVVISLGMRCDAMNVKLEGKMNVEAYLGIYKAENMNHCVIGGKVKENIKKRVK